MDESLSTPSEPSKLPLILAGIAIAGVLLCGYIAWGAKKENANLKNQINALENKISDQSAAAQAAAAANAKIQEIGGAFAQFRADQEGLNENFKKGFRDVSGSFSELTNSLRAGGMRTVGRPPVVPQPANTGGNTGGIVDVQPRTPGAETVHTIVKGDNFSTLSRKYGVTVPAIQAVNPGVSSTRLQPGQKIKIPAKR